MHSNITSLLCISVLALTISACRKDSDVQEPKPEPVTYEVEESAFNTSREGLSIGGRLYSPIGLEGRKPAAIYCHGLTGSYKETEDYARAAAKLGLVTCCFDFCGGHEGISLSAGTRAENSILTELADLTAVYDEIARRPDVDPSRIMVMGGSQGGLVAAMYAGYHPEKVLALGLMFPAFNIPILVRMYVRLDYGGLENVPEYVYFNEAKIWHKYIVDAHGVYPYNFIGAFEGPVFMIHGDKDEVVNVSYSKKALELYKDASLTVLEGQNHGFDAEGQAIAIDYMNDFIIKTLGL